MTTATLEGHPVTSATLAWPTFGLWWADAYLADPVELSGRVSLAIAGTTFSGTVVSGGVFNGRAAYRIVAGAGGVSAALPKKGYVNDAGTSIITVLSDAARTAGETLTSIPTGRLGPNYARMAGDTLGGLLNRHHPRAWYANPDGSLRIGTRLATTYAGNAPRVRVDQVGAVVDLAVDSLDDLAPGVQVDGGAPATDLQIDLTPERLTVRVYSGKRTTRRLDALARILKGVFPTLAYAGAFEYRVITAAAGKANLQPVRAASGMPDLRNVTIRQGAYGLIDQIPPGELVLVCFADNDPSRPQVFARGSTDSPTWLPTLLSFPVAVMRLGSPTPSLTLTAI